MKFEQFLGLDLPDRSDGIAEVELVDQLEATSPVIQVRGRWKLLQHEDRRRSRRADPGDGADDDVDVVVVTHDARAESDEVVLAHAQSRAPLRPRGRARWSDFNAEPHDSRAGARDMPDDGVRDRGGVREDDVRSLD